MNEEMPKLMEFLRNYSQYGFVRAASAASVLAPLFSLAGENGRLALVDAALADAAVTGRLLSAALGQPVRRVEFVSRAALLDLTGQAAARLQRNFAADAGCGFELMLWSLFGRGVWEQLDEIRLQDRLRLGLHYYLGHALKRHFLEPPLAWDSVWSSIVYYVGAILIGDEQLTERLEPLVGLLTRAIPLAEKNKETGVWLVLAA